MAGTSTSDVSVAIEKVCLGQVHHQRSLLRCLVRPVGVTWGGPPSPRLDPDDQALERFPLMNSRIILRPGWNPMGWN